MYFLIAVWALCMIMIVLLLHLRHLYLVRDDAWVLRNSMENQVTDRRIDLVSARTAAARHRTAYRIVRDVLLLVSLGLTAVTVVWTVNSHPANAPYLAVRSPSVIVDTRLLAGCLSILFFWGLWVALLLCGRSILDREQSVLVGAEPMDVHLSPDADTGSKCGEAVTS